MAPGAEAVGAEEQAPVSSVHCAAIPRGNRPSRLSAKLGTPSECLTVHEPRLTATCLGKTIAESPGVDRQHESASLREHSLSDMLDKQAVPSTSLKRLGSQSQSLCNQGVEPQPAAVKLPVHPQQQHNWPATAPAALASTAPTATAEHVTPAQQANSPTGAGMKPVTVSPSKTADDDDDLLIDAAYSGENSDLLPLDFSVPWYKTPKTLAKLALLLASAGLVLAGLLVQGLIADDVLDDAAFEIKEAYPWLYFFAACAPLLLGFRWLCWRLYKAAEYTAIREELYFLRPLRAKIASVLFWITIPLWFKVCFTWVWCQGLLCEQPSYQEALDIVWKLLICLTLFSVANFVKCSLARFLSYSFYKTAHFTKVKVAIERELYLIRLSKARRLLVRAPTPLPGTARCSQLHTLGGHDDCATPKPGWLGRGSVIAQMASQIFGPRSSNGDAVGNQAGTAAGSLPKHMHSSIMGGSSPFISHAAHHPAGELDDYDAADNECTAYVQLSSGSNKQQQKLQDCLTHDHKRPEDGTRLLRSGVSSASVCPEVSEASFVGKPSFSMSSKSSVLWDVRTAAADGEAGVTGRHASFEMFCRVPSILGPASQKAAGSKAKMGSRTGLWGASKGSKGSKASRVGSRVGSKVALPNMLPGVGDLLLQPEVVEEVTMSNVKQSFGGPGPAVAEEEMIALRKALGVNTYGTFVDRYYGMTSKEEAAHVRHVKHFAKVLFYNIKGEADRDHLLPNDFLIFFDGDAETAQEAFEYFDRNNDGSISCLELQESAAEMLCERKNIAASIKDTDSVVDSLETGLGLLVHFIFFIFYLMVWGINIVKGFSTFSATVLALTFVFGDSVKSVFESAIFLFVEHPYDVGDLLCMPPNNTMARVKKIDLMYTQLLRGSGELVWHPNSLMREMVLVNVSRSSNKCEVHSWLVDLDTPDEVLDFVRKAVAAHVAANPSHFASRTSFLVTWRAMEEPLKLRLAVSVTYSFTGEDVRRLFIVRTALLSVVRQELQHAGVRYTLPSTGMGLPTTFAQQL